MKYDEGEKMVLFAYRLFLFTVGVCIPAIMIATGLYMLT